MAGKRSYDDGCATAHALDLVGERWALLVVRELLLGPKRFTDLREGLPGISPNVLSQRLRELEQAGVVRRSKLGPPYGAKVYELTEWGVQLEPVIVQLGRWACRSPWLAHDAEVGTDSLILALRTLFDPVAARAFAATFTLVLGEQSFEIVVRQGRFRVSRGGADRPDAVIDTDVQTLNALLWGSRKLSEAVRGDAVRIAGPRALVSRLLTLFPLPEQAPLLTGT
ncbi:winged helix-turn-helix transcriptional regulator [Amycolatopsis anabasis]|uniref:winged helix-turn-helix transcriptional regulator n=1 Tax=Amycolatopsis anabasis TaxID=1840409 RepID=UPI00131C98EA|nr:helix-turn-helix domain-containing protein [Amycolatopsis anabasis]